MPEANVALVRRIQEEVWSRGDLSALDEIFSPHFVGHATGGATWRGPQAVRDLVLQWRLAFPDWTETAHDFVAQGDKVAVRYTSRGTHAGELLGVSPTGRVVEITEMAMFRFEGSRVAEQWTETDLFSLLQQIGAVTLPSRWRDGRDRRD